MLHGGGGDLDMKILQPVDTCDGERCDLEMAFAFLTI